MRFLPVAGVLSVLALGSSARAATISVSPGPGTPIQDAIDAAAPGDTIRLTNGGIPGSPHFTEHVRVTKRLRVIGLGRGSTFIDVPCTEAIGVEVAADDVILRGFTVTGAMVTAIDITGRSNVQLSDVEARDDPFHCDTADYGINVVASTRVKILRSTAIGISYAGGVGDGYDEAGIRLSGIGDGGNVSLKGGFVGDHVRGLVIEDSADLPGGSPGIRVSRTEIRGTVVGTLVTNSDRVRIDHSEIRSGGYPPPEPGSVGVLLDATSDENVVQTSWIVGFETDVRDDGTGNCWLRNYFGTGSVDCN